MLNIKWNEEDAYIRLENYLNIPAVKEFYNDIPLGLDEKTFQHFYKKYNLELVHSVQNKENNMAHYFDRYGSYPDTNKEKQFMPTGQREDDISLTEFNAEIQITEIVNNMKQFSDKIIITRLDNSVVEINC
jgi:hypothetical protein